MMNVLWFECTTPGRYKGDGAVLGGWQDSLEQILCTVPNLRLSIAFEADSECGSKIIDGVKYIPIYLQHSEEKKSNKNQWELYAEKLTHAMLHVVENVQPDIIHVFGTEWAFGLIANHTKIPVVIHIQGAIVPFNNALYPPRYSIFDIIRNAGIRHPQTMWKLWNLYKNDLSREDVERKVWKAVSNYMGRTEWDKGLSAVMHPGRRYFHVEEALRPCFTSGELTWKGLNSKKLKLVSTGIMSFRKGPDMMVKVAHILTDLGVDFEWNVAGIIPYDARQIIERKDKLSFNNCHINILGFKNADEVSKLLLESSMFIHTSYAENSPNSICEAQCVGVPVVSTNVGGIATLVHDKEDGILVPANDPWQMAYQILQLFENKARMEKYSQRAKERALARHFPENIKSQLLGCYNSLLQSK